MPRPTCSYCGERQRDKPSQIYQWWYTAEGDRLSYKLMACVDCMVERWKTILQTSNSISTGEPTCIGCGGSLDGDEVTVYLDLYLPKRLVREYVLDFDAACAARICGDTSEFGRRLPNRGAGNQGPGSSAPELSSWDLLEL